MVDLVRYQMRKKAFILHEHILVQKIDNNIVLLDAEASHLHSLNETGTYIFEELQKNADIGRIAELISKQFTVSKEQAKKDIVDLYETLKKKKVIVS